MFLLLGRSDAGRCCGERRRLAGEAAWEEKWKFPRAAAPWQASLAVRAAWVWQLTSPALGRGRDHEPGKLWPP